jgi:hypothetical protein
MAATDAPQPSVSAAITSAVSDPFDRGAGRCDATGGFIGARRTARRAQSGLTARLLNADGTEHLVPLAVNHKAVRALTERAEASALSWDGTVIDAAGNTHYVDVDTIRGKYPIDCPPTLRSRIGNIAASLDDIRDQHEIRLELALHARSKQYKVTDAELRAVRDRSTSYVDRARLNGSASVRPVSTLDREAISDLLQAHEMWNTLLVNDAERAWHSSSTAPTNGLEPQSLVLAKPADTSELATQVFAAIEEGVPFVGLYDHSGRLCGLKGKLPATGSRAAMRLSMGATMSWDSRVLYSAIAGNLEKHLRTSFDRARQEQRCFTCSSSRSLCSCPRSASGVCEMLAQTANSSPTSSEHQWSPEHGVALTAEMVKNAKRQTQHIRDLAVATAPELATKIDTLTAGEGFASIALFLEQTGLPDQEREALLTDPEAITYLATIFERTTHRAANIHTDYVRALYAEFDAADAPLASEGLSETYLGRDGVYALYAREEMRRSYQARSDERAERNTIRYLSVSRRASWDKRHHKLLGDRPVMIDTGFEGSIPVKIAKNQGLELLHDNTTAPAERQAAVRLLRANSRGFGFQWQAYTDPLIDEIEGDAKLTRSARYVGDKAPAGALEQLVHRHLEHCIRTHARDQIQEILQAERSGSVDLAHIGTARFRKRPATA